MGEPFFGRTPGEDGLIVWFEQADRNHDGFLTSDEMQADADRFFATLDTNHDGEIDPDEITHYEDVIAPEVLTGPTPRAERQLAGSQQESRGGGDDEAGAGRFGLLQIPEPVASADADFDRSVSAQEFRQAAIARFQLLDVAHAGRLTLPNLETIRQAAASAAKRPPRTPVSDDQASPDGGDSEPMPGGR